MMINWLRFWNVFGSAIISALLGIGTAETIGKLNHNMVYGYYVSYVITALLVVLFNIPYIDFERKEVK